MTDVNPIARVRAATEVVEETLNYVAGGGGDAIYVGPRDAHDRFIAGDIVTHCQFVQDHSRWTFETMHPERLRRLRRMLDATRPRYDCDTCRIGCNSAPPTNPERIGWHNGKPTCSTEDTRHA